MFVIVNLQATAHIWSVGMCIIYIHTKFHLPSSSTPLVTTNGTDSEKNTLHAQLFFFLVFTENRLEKGWVLFEDVLLFMISGP
jgi:hypothetical protein